MTSRSEQFERLRPLLAPAISLALIGLAGFVIHRITEDIGSAEIKAAVQAVPLANVGFAIAFTAMSFCALAILDVLAVRSVAPGAVTDRRAAIAGALGYAISNVLGFGVVTGGALRYRIYSAEGLDAADVLRVTTTSYLAFWFGIATLLGLALIIDPVDLGMAALVGVPTETALGVVLLGLVGAALIWTGRAPRHLSFGGWSIPIPSPAIAAAQWAAGSFDIAVSAAVLYVLLPAEARPILPYFLAVYVGALSLGTLSHAPGGLGIFEATIIRRDRPRSQRRRDRGARPLSPRLLRASLHHRPCRPRGVRGGAAAAFPHGRRRRHGADSPAYRAACGRGDRVRRRAGAALLGLASRHGKPPAFPASRRRTSADRDLAPDRQRRRRVAAHPRARAASPPAHGVARLDGASRRRRRCLADQGHRD